MPDIEISLGFRPTPPRTIFRALMLAEVTDRDLLFDLGSGDGSVIIAAATTHGVQGRGVEVDPDLIKISRHAAMRAGVQNLVDFSLCDLFEADVTGATVVFLALMLEANLELRSKLISTLKPGSRIISFKHNMGQWAPTKQTEIDGEAIYLWTITDALKRDSSFTDSCKVLVHSTRKVGSRTIYFWNKTT